MHPDDRFQLQSALTESIEKGVSNKVEYRAVCKDGEYKWVEISAKVVRNDQTRQDEVIAAVRNITERKQAEEALQKSEENYRSIFENSVEGFFQSTPEGRFLSVNPAFVRIFGYSSPEELISTISDISQHYYVNQEDRFRYMKILQEKGAVENYEFKAQRKDGSQVWISNSTRAIVSSEGKIIRYDGIVEDITNRKQTEEELRERDIKFMKLSAWVPGMIYQFTKRADGTYYVPFATEAIKDIFGCTPQDVREDFSPIARVI